MQWQCYSMCVKDVSLNCHFVTGGRHDGVTS
jgi:hypothetical protein